MTDDISGNLRDLGIYPPPKFGIFDGRTWPISSQEIDPDSTAGQIARAEEAKRQLRVQEAERAVAEQQASWELEAAELDRVAAKNAATVARQRALIESLQVERAPLAKKLGELDFEISRRREELRTFLPTKRVERGPDGRILQIVPVTR